MRKITPYSTQVIDRKDITAVVKVLNSKFLTQGPTVGKFEKAVARKVNAKYSVAFNSATSALHASCLALALKKNEIVWTVPNTFVASANCALLAGGKVDFVDINPTTKNMDIEALEKKLIKAKKQKNFPR
jgi:dTDP-4-amino-4,6-dideoxygalactose transaminase